MRNSSYKDFTDEEVVEMYVERKMSLFQIYKELHIGAPRIKNILNKHDIQIRDFAEQSGIENHRRRFTNRTYSLNYDYFKSINKECAYILGFISADGSIYNGRLKVELKRQDAYILEYFKSQLQYTGDVKYTISKIKDKAYETARLSINSIDLCETLLKYGITENKSFTLNISNIPNEYELDFIRGYFDGNGYTKVGKYARFGICSASLDLIKWILNILAKNGLKTANISTIKNVHHIEYAQADSIKFYKLMYTKDNPCLIRKKEYFERYIKN